MDNSNPAQPFTLGVCGAGTMGSGIAQAAAQAGLDTWLYDVSETAVMHAQRQIENNLRTLVAKQKITPEQQSEILGRLHYHHHLENCRADVIIEAIIEKPEAKIELFRQLAQYNDENTLFASNTSSLSISELQARIPHPQRVAGMHFFNPATIMKLVEVVKGQDTDETVVGALMELARKMHKVPVRCKDAPGFIVNRVARPYYLESLRLLEAGMADVATIDSLLENAGFRMGPFRLMDLIGNDINYAVSCSVYEQMGCPPRLQPSALQQQKVAQGALGRKTGSGYYDYT